ncbi:hypothetical protein [Paenibacillus sp. y28]|uniref:hypothetical protein n=1 Tax=Paenibacillus sp. y28 TaxID=3129110 RepID=UPI003019F180
MFAGLFFFLLAPVLLLISIDAGKRDAVLIGLRQSLRWGMLYPVQYGRRFYASSKADELLETMGWRKYITVPTLKMIRDVLCGLLLVYVLVAYYDEGLWRPLVVVAVVFLFLTPGPGPFSVLIAPLFQRFQRHRVNRDSSLLMQLLRNEMQSESEQSVTAIIREFRPYMQILQDDFVLLEHDWRRGKEEALDRFKRRHPGNEDIRFICSLFKKMDEVGYAACAQMLAQNEATINQRQMANYKSRQDDLNGFLFVVNVSGVMLALLWFVLALFMWVFDMDLGL